MNGKEILTYLIDLFTHYLDQLSELPINEFIHGEMTAYVETLEILQGWVDAKEHGLNYTIQDKYRI